MWALKMTVVNGQTLQQYKVRHMAGLKDADIVLVFNVLCHYTAAGMCETHYWSSDLVAYHLLSW